MRINDKKNKREPEQNMDALARNREELGLPATTGGLSTLIDHLPGIGLVTSVGKAMDMKNRMANPELLHNTAGKALETNYTHEAPWDTYGKEADLQMMSKGGIAGLEGLMSNPEPEMAMPERGTAGMDEEKDPSVIPEDIKEFVRAAHQERQESRPDESWRIVPGEKPGAVDAPYKRDEEDMERAQDEAQDIPAYAEGGEVPDDESLAPVDEGPGPNEPVIPGPAPVVPAAPVAAAPVAPAPTEQSYMDRANKMLGLNPDQQAGFMKLLGDKSQKAQIGAGIAGIGDAIASGGTLGKVNPGALNRSEDLIQGKEKAGIEGMQTIRGNQEKTTELSQKLQAQDPNSPLSKFAQKAYAGIGKKLGLDLSHASASMIGDVSGKGVEALNTEYQNQLKMMGLDLQKKQVEATIGNQKAEREIAKEGHRQEATKTLADQGIGKKIANLVTPSGRAAQRALVKEAIGGDSYSPDVLAYADKHGITPQQAQAQKDRRTKGH